MTVAYRWGEIAGRIRDSVSESQKALALRFEVSESTMSRYLNGTTTPDPVVALQLADLAGLDLYALGGLRPARANQPRSDPFAAPLLRLDVAAGEPRLEVILDVVRPYYFRREWLLRKGWNGDQNDLRFGVYRLGDRDIADSMFPTIQPRSVLLVDRRPDRTSVPPRSIWIVRVQAGGDEDSQLPLLTDQPAHRLTTKRATLVDHQLVLESDNPDPRHAPRIVRCRPGDRATILEGRVIWYATEVETA